MHLRTLGIDPGTKQSGWCVFSNGIVLRSGVSDNEELLAALIAGPADVDMLAIERIASYGMAVGQEIFDTCVWIGRFTQAWMDPNAVSLVFRRDVKLFLCGNARAKDPNIRAALIDLVGPAGSKAKPGPTYGVTTHAWAALGVCVTATQYSPAPQKLGEPA